MIFLISVGSGADVAGRLRVLDAQVEQPRVGVGAGLGRGGEQGTLHPIVSRGNCILPGEYPIQ